MNKKGSVARIIFAFAAFFIIWIIYLNFAASPAFRYNKELITWGFIGVSFVSIFLLTWIVPSLPFKLGVGIAGSIAIYFLTLLIVGPGIFTEYFSAIPGLSFVGDMITFLIPFVIALVASFISMKHY